MLVRTLTILVVTASFLALPSGADGVECVPPTTYNSTQVDKYHMYGTAKEFWEESNGIAGLQRSQTPCVGFTISADTCITHSENGALVNCALEYGLSLLP